MFFYDEIEKKFKPCYWSLKKPKKYPAKLLWQNGNRGEVDQSCEEHALVSFSKTSKIVYRLLSPLKKTFIGFEKLILNCTQSHNTTYNK